MTFGSCRQRAVAWPSKFGWATWRLASVLLGFARTNSQWESFRCKQSSYYLITCFTLGIRTILEPRLTPPGLTASLLYSELTSLSVLASRMQGCLVTGGASFLQQHPALLARQVPQCSRHTAASLRHGLVRASKSRSKSASSTQVSHSSFRLVALSHAVGYFPCSMPDLECIVSEMAQVIESQLEPDRFRVSHLCDFC